MKQVESTVIESIVAFVEMLKKRVDQPFNIHPYVTYKNEQQKKMKQKMKVIKKRISSLFGELTLDVIQRVALGRQSTILNTNEKIPFMV